MGRLLSYGLCTLLLLSAIGGFSHGLRIKGNSYPIEDRTAIDLFHFRSSFQHRKLVEQFTFQFDFRLDQPQGYGNIMRLKLEEPNKTLNIFCRRLDDGRLEIKLVEEGLDQLGAIFLDPKNFEKDQWIHLLLNFDLGQQAINWHVLDQILVIPFPYRTLTYNNVFFGKSDFSIDIADFSIRNLKVSLDNEHLTFPLRESSGNTIHTLEGGSLGRVENPIWLINESYYWQSGRVIELADAGGYQFDAVNGRLLFFDRYQLFMLDLQSNALSSHRFTAPLPIDVRLGTSFLRQEKLYIYEVNDLPIDSPTIVEVDLTTFRSKVISKDFVPMQLHHHTGQSTARIPYLLFGGFGNDRYSNVFLSLDTQDGKWDTVATSGDRIMPRYFTSSFYDERTNDLYLFGGMGNDAADNTIGRVYRYDLYRLSLDTYRMQRLWEQSWSEDNVVPVRNMVYDGTSSFYTLLYPEYRSASALQLYRFSIENGNYMALGDTIPITSEKIKTNANLFFYQPLNTFYAVTQVFDSKEVSSKITVYELKAPAVSHAELIQYASVGSSRSIRWYVWLAGMAAVACISFAVYKRRTKKADKTVSVDQLPLSGAAKPFALPASNAIYLFGKFEVFDKKGVNISHLFSSRLKHVLVLFLSRHPNKGIESSELSNLLWPEKETTSTKNIRGVTLNQFRKLLTNLSGIALVYQDNHYSLQVTNCFVDYLHFKEAYPSGNGSDPTSQAILSRGKFLKTADHELLDDIKDEVDRMVVQVLQRRIETAYVQGDYERVIQVAKLCLETAPTNLEAFQYEIQAMLHLKQRTEVVRRFEHFSHFYQSLMNEPLPLIFRDLEKRRS